ncbi:MULTISPECIES: InlB B-repeat-containing protein, partial [unclassified Eubacterium (in: firmicutes)]|uniref:InlB B-repeat-containing protein n=1 Tax=unclassified Eubacterium (in: firmicutes) TaxID=2624479 RepID=UPI0010214441
SLDLYTWYTQEVPTLEWMEEAIQDGTWITAPANSEYIGAEITDANGTKTYQPGEMYTIISDATIKVLWKSIVIPTTYTITVVDGAADKSTAEAGETVTLTADAPPRGKEFDKWVVNAGGISLADENASTTTFTMPAANVEVTATYKDSTVTPPGPTAYIVTVHRGTADKSAAAANETVKLTADAPPTGKEFDKWVVNAGGISLADENASTTTFTMPAANVEVTATYKDSSVTPPGPTTYTMTFKDGDTVLSTQTVESGQKATKPADPTKDGYTFGGWYADATFSAAFDFDTAIAADTTIYAKFTANSVTPPVTTSTISYNLNGGTLNGKTGTVTLSVENGTTITLPAPTREGYTFDYWEGSRYNAGDSYTVNGDHTFTAQWKKNSTTPGTGDPGKTSPQTGDESNLALWFTMMIASLIAMVLVLLGIRKRKPQEDDR